MKKRKEIKSKRLSISQGVLLLAVASGTTSSNAEVLNQNQSPHNVDQEWVIKVRGNSTRSESILVHKLLSVHELDLGKSELGPIEPDDEEIRISDAKIKEGLESDPIFKSLKEMGILEVEIIEVSSSCNNCHNCMTASKEEKTE